jgi:serine/threonine-protein kinase
VIAVAVAATFAVSRTAPGRRLVASMRATPAAEATAAAAAATSGAPLASAAPREPLAPASAAPATSAAPAPPASAARPTTIDGLDARAWRQVIRRAPHTRDFVRAERAVHALAAIDPEGIASRDMLDAMVDVCVNAGAGPDGGRRLLERLADDFGAGGVDVLYEVVARRGGSTAARNASELLARPDVRARGSDAFRVAIDLRSAPCADKPALAERARVEGDGRALAILAALRGTDCDPTSGACCVFDHPAVERAVRDLDLRLRAR